MAKREEVIEELKGILGELLVEFETLPGQKEFSLEKVVEVIEELKIKYSKEILSIPELAVVDRNAELPTPPALDVKNIQSVNDPEYRAWEEYLKGYKRAQQDMLEANWTREVKDDQT